MTGFGSGAPRSATPYSVSMPTIFGTATERSLLALPRRTRRLLGPRLVSGGAPQRLTQAASSVFEDSLRTTNGRSTTRYDSVATTNASATNTAATSGKRMVDRNGASRRAQFVGCRAAAGSDSARGRGCS